MSFYATIQGTIHYPNKEAFDAAKKSLDDGQWINEDGMFLDECNAVIEDGTMDPNVNAGNLTITIPCFCHRNLARMLDALTKGTTGRVVWTSTDGCLAGGVIEDGIEASYDLDKWNEQQGGDEAPDSESDGDAWSEWANGVEQDFHDEFA